MIRAVLFSERLPQSYRQSLLQELRTRKAGVQDKGGFTPLHAACFAADAASVEALLTHSDDCGESQQVGCR